MANVDDDFVSNRSDNETFAQVIAAQLSRRQVVGGGLAAAAVAGAGGIGSLLNAVPAQARNQATGGRGLLGFKGIPVSSADTVVVHYHGHEDVWDEAINIDRIVTERR